jgi:GxxExxY protein
MKTKEEIDRLCDDVIGACIEVHRHLGPGLLEDVYKEALAIEFDLRNISFEKEFEFIPVYKGMILNHVYRCDFFIEKSVVLEIKAVQELIPKHTAQTINYVTISKAPTALLINFNEILLRDGIKRLFPRT